MLISHQEQELLREIVKKMCRSDILMYKVDCLMKILKVLFRIQVVLLVMTCVNLFAIVTNMTRADILNGCSIFAVILIIAYNIVFWSWVYARKRAKANFQESNVLHDEVVRLRDQYVEMISKEKE